MPAKKSTKKSAKKVVKKNTKIKEPHFYLAVCRDCKIQLIVKKEDAIPCIVCESSNISLEPWR